MLDWNAIDTVFLDMDGTLLDLRFDNHFWLEHVPLRYAESRGISLAASKDDLYGRYQALMGSLQWYSVDHWSQELALDIAMLKAEVEHLIAIHPHVLAFLEALAEAGKRRVLVTNAHQKSIALKMRKTRLDGHLERIICSHDLQAAKESAEFWPRVQEIESFDSQRTLFVDDSLPVLRAARQYGFRWLLAILAPDSSQPARACEEFNAIEDFSTLLPGLAAMATLRSGLEAGIAAPPGG
ncbi:MAG: GMP/IMP nucleotidase [Halochromatium sp.]|nr:GMP/IMP nucleotidase [Halochromatium sp.]